jgi:cell division protein FtsB
MNKLKDNIINLFKDKRRTQWFLVGCVCLLLLIYVLFSNYGIVNTLKLQGNQKKLITAIEREKHAHDSLTKRYRLLKRDTLYIEQVAREKYGLVKPNEKVFIMKDKSAE